MRGRVNAIRTFKGLVADLRYNKNYWNSVPGNLYIDVPQQVQDEQITVLAVLLDGPIKLYRGVGQVQDNN